MAKIIIFGIGEQGQLAHYYFTKDSPHEVVAFTVDPEYLSGAESFQQLPVVSFDRIEQSYPPGQYKIFVAIGYRKVNKIRSEKYFEAKRKGYEFISYISSRATIFDNVEIGENCFLLEDNTIQPFVRIGNNVTLWSGNHIGHHAVIHDHCFITSHVVVSGGAVVDEYCFIGVNATIRDHIKLGRETVIGAACLILKDTQERAVYIGDASEPRVITSDKLRRI